MTAPTCPHCRKPTHLGRDNPWRPFCCERCKLVDLGAWMDGRYAIAAEESEPGQEPPGQDAW